MSALQTTSVSNIENLTVIPAKSTEFQTTVELHQGGLGHTETSPLPTRHEPGVIGPFFF